MPSVPPPIGHELRWEPFAHDLYSITLEWLGGRYAIDPILRVTKQGSRVALAVFDGHQPVLASNEVCGDVGIGY